MINKLLEIEKSACIMSPPYYVDNDEPINIYMKQTKNSKINNLLMTSQWFEVYRFISNYYTVFLVPPHPDAQDMTYTSNQGLFLPDDNIFILSNFLHDARKIEEKPVEDFVKKLGFDVIQSPYTFEGEADCKLLKENVYCVAYGMRTEKAFSEWFSETFEKTVIPIRIKDPHTYHLDCLLFPLNSENLIVAVNYLDKEELKKIEKYTNIIPIENEYDVVNGSTNCIQIANQIVLNQIYGETDDEFARAKRLEKILNKQGYELVTFNFSEFFKSGAAISCIFLRMTYTEFMVPAP